MIRRRLIRAGTKRSVALPGVPNADAVSALQQGRDAVRQALSLSAGAVRKEVEQAREVFAQAGKSLSAEAAPVAAAADAAGQGQTAARTAIASMLEQMNRITASFAAKQNPPPDAEKTPK